MRLNRLLATHNEPSGVFADAWNIPPFQLEMRSDSRAFQLNDVTRSVVTQSPPAWSAKMFTIYRWVTVGRQTPGLKANAVKSVDIGG